MTTENDSRLQIGLQSQFDDIGQQRESVRLGMWTFLATEVLFFGTAFTLYIAYRSVHGEAWKIGSSHMDFWLGTVNTAILLLSSLTMALAVRAIRERHRGVVRNLSLTWILGASFLGIKFYEYYRHWKENLVPGPGFEYKGAHEQAVELFVSFYYVMTGMHAFHMLIGLAVVGWLIVMTARGRINQHQYAPIFVAGLYWHFVDIVWIFLYPAFYLL